MHDEIPEHNDIAIVRKLRKVTLTVKTALLAWGLIIVTITVFLIFNLRFQNVLLQRRMSLEADDAASALVQANANALYMEDYQNVIAYGLSITQGSKSIRNIIVVKMDGTALYFSKGVWEMKKLDGRWVNPPDSGKGVIVHSDLLHGESFVYSKKFVYSGIEWGWVHIALSLDEYDKSVNELILWTVWMAAGLIFFGLIASFYFSKLLTRPLNVLAVMAKKIEGGDLSARAPKAANDEIGLLTQLFNKMADAIDENQLELERKIFDRTKELEQMNLSLTNEVATRRQAEEELNKYAVQLKTSLDEKEILLKEVHHRVKNNLQIVSSLLSLQINHIHDKRDVALFTESQNRVKSMAMIHEQLYRSENIGMIDFRTYIRNLSSSLVKTYSVNGNANLVFDVTDVVLDLETAIPCGLIINELVSNSLKYAFPGDRQGEINIGMHGNADKSYTLTVSDDGIGIPAELVLEDCLSLGLRLVRILTSQLQGTLSLEREPGTRFTITFDTLNN